MGLPRRQSMGIKAGLMGRVYIHVFGCRTSLCEGEYIAGGLMSLGHEVTEDLTDDISSAVIVTCSVTQEADRKCRNLIRRARKVLGDEGILAVCGCWSQAVDSEAAREMGVDILAGTKGKRLIPDAVNDMMRHGRGFRDMRIREIFTPSEWEELPIISPVMHSRAFVKIQDGCDHFCTYCIIPYLRGRPVSRPPENIISEIHRLVDSGTKEVIFTGIHLGVYGRDIDTSLSELIRRAAKIDGLKRLRLGSLEPFCLDDELMSTLADCESFCQHLHLPLQSGDDGILSAMRRGYTARDFVRVCDSARSKISPDIHISTDIITGFPGENDSAFLHTLDIMRASGLGRVHVFPYSARRGTIAADMPGQVPSPVKAARTSEAISLGRELYESYARKFIGHEAEILIERDNRGHTRHYIEATCTGNDNEIVKAEVIRFDGSGLECVRRD
ncbi:MAG: MiaB/RimO family radical SAM methylthiotransferase [Synergistaceae bacterium]|nr:MiaB/RimO family radical SAM methylthiotransferase [Synergistaceae bacterium]